MSKVKGTLKFLVRFLDKMIRVFIKIITSPIWISIKIHKLSEAAAYFGFLLGLVGFIPLTAYFHASVEVGMILLFPTAWLGSVTFPIIAVLISKSYRGYINLRTWAYGKEKRKRKEIGSTLLRENWLKLMLHIAILISFPLMLLLFFHLVGIGMHRASLLDHGEQVPDMNLVEFFLYAGLTFVSFLWCLLGVAIYSVGGGFSDFIKSVDVILRLRRVKKENEDFNNSQNYEDDNIEIQDEEGALEVGNSSLS